MTAALGFVIGQSFCISFHRTRLVSLSDAAVARLSVIAGVQCGALSDAGGECFCQPGTADAGDGLVVVIIDGADQCVIWPIWHASIGSVPGWQLWLYSSLLLLLAAACYQPASRLAERLIYPGVQLNQPMVSQWQQQLSQAR